MAEVRDIVKSLKKRNRLIFMSSHLLNEVSEVCDEVAMIDHGKLVVYDTIENVEARFSGNGGVELVEVGLSRPVDDGLLAKSVSSLSGVIAVEKATRQKLFDEYINRIFESRSDIAVVLADIDSLSKQIESAEASLPALEQLAVSYKSAYENGSADVLSFYAAQNDVAKKTVEILKLKQELTESHIGLEIAAGRYIPQQSGLKEAVK
jgi:ABC-type multidrug transport system ATPase subunit